MAGLSTKTDKIGAILKALGGDLSTIYGSELPQILVFIQDIEEPALYIHEGVKYPWDEVEKIKRRAERINPKSKAIIINVE